MKPGKTEDNFFLRMINAMPTLEQKGVLEIQLCPQLDLLDAIP